MNVAYKFSNIDRKARSGKSICLARRVSIKIFEK